MTSNWQHKFSESNAQKMLQNELTSICEVQTTAPGWKVWICRECNLKCQSKFSFITHYRIHTGEKPFACPHCSYRGNQKSNLTVHLKNKHKDLAEGYNM